MEKCTQRFHVDQSEKGFFVCSACECSLGVHCAFSHCPLLENELICTDCCHNEVIEPTIIAKLKDIGLEYTREQIDKICNECGNRSVGVPAEESNDDNRKGLPGS